MMEEVQPRIVQIMPMGYEVDEAILDAYAQHLLQALVDEKEDKVGTSQEKGIKVHQEQVAPTIRRKMTKAVAETLISERNDRTQIEQKVKILEAQRKEEMKQKRKEEREAKKVAQATPNVVSVSTESSKQPEASLAELASSKLTKLVKRKQKATQQYIIVSLEETKLDEEIKVTPNKKGVFASIVREKKEEQNKDYLFT